MVYLIINQQNKSFERFRQADAFHNADHEHEQNTPGYDGEFAQYKISLSVCDDGRVVMTDKSTEDLEDGVTICRVKAGLSNDQKAMLIKRLEKDLTVAFSSESNSYSICLPQQKPKKSLGLMHS
jgi:hypothetical protein